MRMSLPTAGFLSQDMVFNLAAKVAPSGAPGRAGGGGAVGSGPAQGLPRSEWVTVVTPERLEEVRRGLASMASPSMCTASTASPSIAASTPGSMTVSVADLAGGNGIVVGMGVPSPSLSSLSVLSSVPSFVVSSTAVVSDTGTQEADVQVPRGAIGREFPGALGVPLPVAKSSLGVQSSVSSRVMSESVEMRSTAFSNASRVKEVSEAQVASPTLFVGSDQMKTSVISLRADGCNSRESACCADGCVQAVV